MEDFKETSRLPRVLTTAVGSLPHSDPLQAVEMIVAALGKAPHIPQLSRSNPREQMWIQFTENLPHFEVDFEKLSYAFDASGDSDADVEEFFVQYLQVLEGGASEHFAISSEYGQSIHVLLDRFREGGKKLPFIKLQVTGPLSFALTVTDEKRKPIFYHPVFRDVAVKAMGLKAVWLVDRFKPYAEEVIVFFDEPSLSAYGSSAFLGVSKNDVIESLNDVIGMVLDRGGIPGVHCCGNTDWGLLMETDTRIVNFDAVDFMESMTIYRNELTDFLGRGGVLAWGAVPNTEQARKETATDVVKRVHSGLELLTNGGLDRGALTERMILTPACGCAGLTVDDTQSVYDILSDLDSMTPEAILGE